MKNYWVPWLCQALFFSFSKQLLDIICLVISLSNFSPCCFFGMTFLSTFLCAIYHTPSSSSVLLYFCIVSSGSECAESRMSLPVKFIGQTIAMRECCLLYPHRLFLYLGNEDKRTIKTGITTCRSIFLHLKRNYDYEISRSNEISYYQCSQGKFWSWNQHFLVL